MKMIVVALALTFSGAISAAPAGSITEIHSRGDLPLTSCDAGHGESGLCGKHTVFENREAGTGRTIDLHILILPATDDAVLEPIFFLTGGPGEAATDAAGMFLDDRWTSIRHKRDIVLVDQRGTGRSNGLYCPLTEPNASLRALNVLEISKDFIEQCLHSLGSRADVSSYTTPTAMDDLDEVRQALGYEKIVIYGASYGTRAAFVFMRRHPEAIHSVVLRAIAPVNMRAVLPAARHAQNAFEGLARRCRDDRECATRHSGPESALAQVLARLEENPAVLPAKHPSTGEPVEVVLTRDIFAGFIPWLLASDVGQDLFMPMLTAAQKGDFEPFLSSALPISVGATSSWSLGMALTVICSEDMAFVDAREIDAATAGTFMGGQRVRNGLRVCEAWPRAAIGLDYLVPVRSDLPVLMISGEYDPIDGLDLAIDAERYLSNVTHIILPGGTHQPQFPGGTMDEVHAFLDASPTTRTPTAPRISDPSVRKNPTASR